ncbi:hypothetical protein JXA48_01445 [Candidatus Woesearchaeota archaeon]|nr:hypothetical protein [Candidatus Woesearchaeota archaeon]
MNRKKSFIFLFFILFFLLTLFLVNALITVNSNPTKTEGYTQSVVKYIDPVIGQNELTLTYLTVLNEGDVLTVSLSAPRASAKNNFELASLDGKTYSPESMAVSADGVVARWAINLNEDSQIGLRNINGEIIHFTVQIVETTLKTTVDTNSPEYVFIGKEFNIQTRQVSDELRELSLDPACSFETNNIDEITQEQIFHCSIQKDTLFNLYLSGEKINTFGVKVYPLDYCSPSCAINQVCMNNVCKTKYILAGLACSSTSLPCESGYICRDNICKHILITKNDGESCYEEYEVCAIGLECGADYICKNLVDNIFYVGLGEYCNNQNYKCDGDNLACLNGVCELSLTNSQPVIVGAGEFCDNQMYYCKEDFICNGVCVVNTTINPTEINSTTNITNETQDDDSTINTTNDDLTFENITNNTTQNSTIISTPVKITDDNSTLYLIKQLPTQEKTLANKTNLSKYSVERFGDTLKEKVKIPEKATQLVAKQPEKIIRIETNEPRNFTQITESKIETPSVNLTNQSRDDLTKILQREKVLKTNINQQQEKANEKVRIQKKVVYEQEEKKSEKTQEDISTKVVIRVEPIQNQTSIDVVEVIPKEVALSAQDLIYSIQPIILEDDPVIMWHLENVDEPVELSYRVEKNVSLTGNTILLSDDVKPDFDWRTLLPLLFIPLIGGLVVGFSKFEESRKKGSEDLEVIKK